MQKVRVTAEVVHNTPTVKQLRFLADTPLLVMRFRGMDDYREEFTQTFIASGVKRFILPNDRRTLVHETMLFAEYGGKIDFMDLAFKGETMTAHLEMLGLLFPNIEFVYDLSQVPDGFFTE